MKRKLLLILTLSLLISACAKAPDRYSNVAINLGFNDAPVTFVAYTTSQAEFDKYFEQLKEDLMFLGQLFDRYNDYPNLNNLKTINDNAGIKAIEVDQNLIDLLVFARDWSTLSQNSFNVTLGAVLDIWSDYRNEGKLKNTADPVEYGRIPSLGLLQQADTCTGWGFVEIDDQANTVFITNPCTRLDVGGIAKGFAIDIAVKKLLDAGLETAIINIGDSSIITIGTKPNGDEWGVGIAQPKRNVIFADGSVDTLYFKDSIHISTSGDNQNYYLAEDGEYYHHLIDPITLFPAKTPLHSVTVATSLSAGAAEALSKAMFILSYEEALSLLAELKRTFPNDTIEATWVYELNQAPVESIESQGFSVVHSDGIDARLLR